MNEAEKRLRELILERTYSDPAKAQYEADIAALKAGERAEALEEAAQIAHAEAEECDRLKRNADGYGLAGVRQCWQAGQTAAESIEGRIRALITVDGR